MWFYDLSTRLVHFKYECYTKRYTLPLFDSFKQRKKTQNLWFQAFSHW